jgi:hypothetical protein
VSAVSRQHATKSRQLKSGLGVALCGMLLWISEVVPIGLTALIVLVLLGTIPGLRPMHVFGGFALPVVFFLIGAVGIATAVEHTGLARRAAHWLLRGARGKPSRLYFQMLVCLPGLAVFVPSAITRNAILIPMYRTSLATLGLGAADAPARALILALGVLNPLASSMLLTGGLVSMNLVSPARWLLLAALVYLDGRALLPAPAARRLYPVVHYAMGGMSDHCTAARGAAPPFTAGGAPHAAGAAAPGVLTWAQLETRLSWGLLLTIGTSLSLANVMTTSTVGPWLGHLGARAANTRGRSPPGPQARHALRRLGWPLGQQEAQDSPRRRPTHRRVYGTQALLDPNVQAIISYVRGRHHWVLLHH